MMVTANWQELYRRTRDPKDPSRLIPVENLANAMIALRSAAMWEDVFVLEDDAVMVMQPGKKHKRPLTRYEVIRCQDWLQSDGGLPTIDVDTVFNAISLVAFETADELALLKNVKEKRAA
jgi:hypothetical protein